MIDKVTMKDIYNLAEKTHELVNSLRDEIRETYVTKEKHTSDLEPIKKIMWIVLTALLSTIVVGVLALLGLKS